jgi:hypothetical protein
MQLLTAADKYPDFLYKLGLTVEDELETNSKYDLGTLYMMLSLDYLLDAYNHAHACGDQGSDLTLQVRAHVQDIAVQLGGANIDFDYIVFEPSYYFIGKQDYYNFDNSTT